MHPRQNGTETLSISLKILLNSFKQTGLEPAVVVKPLPPNCCKTDPPPLPHSSLPAAECIALRLRLSRQHRTPGSVDLSTDPVLERQVVGMLREDTIQSLVRDRERAALQIGQLEAELEATRVQLAAATTAST